jgi:hypothetical protein
MKRQRIRIAALALALLGSALAASLAHAELTAQGDLFVKFSGGIEPDALPRKARAPIAIRVAGVVRTLSGAQPPALRRIVIGINRGGRLDAHGLPVCHRHEIEPSSSAEALAICGDAQVGAGSYAGSITFPDQGTYESRGDIVAFNSRIGGQRAILAHVYSEDPVPLTFVIVFRISRGSGAFGTILAGTVPESLIRRGYLKRITLELHRDYVYRGRPRSYLSAACDAPAGFHGAVFPFARAAMAFDDGRTLSSTLTRTCKVQSD